MGEDARLIGGNQMFSEVEFVGKEEIVCEKNAQFVPMGIPMLCLKILSPTEK